MKIKMLRITSDPNNILKVEPYLQQVSTFYQISEERYPDILISLTEAVNNAILHGNKSDDSKYVRIALEENNSELAFSVSDEGTGFDPREIPDPTTPELIECCGGRGVFIISQLADRVVFKNNGSTVKIFFKLRRV